MTVTCSIRKVLLHPIFILIVGVWLGMHLQQLTTIVRSVPPSLLASTSPAIISVFTISSGVHQLDAIKSPVSEAKSSLLSTLSLSPTKRLLFMTASYSLEQFLSLQKVFDNMLDLCNSGEWDVVIHLSVSNGMNNTDSIYYQAVRKQLFCIHSNDHIPLVVQGYDKIGFGLNSRHRTYLKEHIHEYDYFAYAEEDMLLSVSQIKAYLHATDELKSIYPTDWMRYSIGFLRWEDCPKKNARVTWEYLPDQIHVVNTVLTENGSTTSYIITNNLNQAINIFPREQLLYLDDRCNYLNDIGANLFYNALRKALNSEWKHLSVGVSEWTSSFQHILQCGIRRIIPVSRFQQHMIHHATNKGHGRKNIDTLLSIDDWYRLIDSKKKAANDAVSSRNRSNSIDDVYTTTIYKQFNLDLIVRDSLVDKKWGKHSVWSYN